MIKTLLEKGLVFLIQEIGREINTIGSKSPQVYITNHVVEMKDLLEKNTRANSKRLMSINIITISAPSGSGKTTLCKALRKVREDILWSVSFTTREPRKNERNGLDYHFVSKNEFKQRIKEKDFIEWQNVHGNYYGTPE